MSSAGRHYTSISRRSRALAEPLEARRLLSASLLKDINTTPLDTSLQIAGTGGILYFVASDPTHGFELWKSDGTAAGTAMVADIDPGPASSHITDLTVLNGVVYFAATDGVHGSELWRSDGTAAGTVMLKEVYVGPASSSPSSLTTYNGQLYFIATSPAYGREIWTTDGTTNGTRLAFDLVAGSQSSYPQYLVSAGSRLFFSASGYLWSSAGSALSNVKLTQDPFEYAPSGNYLYFQNSSRGLSRTDGTIAGTKVLTSSGYASHIIGTGNSQVIFSADDGVHGYELWKSDGTVAGTALLQDINSGPADGYANFQPGPRASANGKAFFIADNGNTIALWQSDGTAAGTKLVTDVNGRSFRWPDTIASAGGLVYFSNGSTLYRTDGTTAGTFAVADVGAGSAVGVTDTGGKMFFVGTGSGGTLWAGDGTAAGTALVSTVSLPTAGDVTDADFAAVGPITYFVADDGTTGPEVWRTDGTAAGTGLLKDIDPVYGSYPSELTNVNGMLLFSARGSSGYELYRSDGTAAGTVLVKDINPGSNSSMPQHLTVVGNQVFFVATDATGGQELWKTDGTLAGTVRVKDIFPGSTGSAPQNLTAVGGLLFLTADDGTDGRELWKSDGTAAGTVMVKDLSPGSGGTSFPNPGEYAALGTTKLVFVANDGSHGYEAWVSDGTAAGTQLLADANPGTADGLSAYGTDMGTFNGRVFYGVKGAGGYCDLWATDGTPAGTSRFLSLAAYEVGGFTQLGNQMIFSSYDPYGQSIWQTDGTLPGTGTLASGTDAPWWPPGDGSAVFGGRVYFMASDSLDGWELYSTDGTPEGTGIAADLRPGGDDGMNSQYNALYVNGNRLFFTGNDGTSGLSVWILTLPAPSIAPATVAEGGSVTLSAMPSGTTSDPSSPITYVWDLDGDGIFGETGSAAARGDETGPTPTFSTAGLQAGSYPVAVVATNSAGYASAAGTVTVVNQPPTVTLILPTGPFSEGDLFPISATITDAQIDLSAGLSVTWSITRDALPFASGIGASLSVQLADQGQYVVTFSATDIHGTTGTCSYAFSAVPVAPVATLILAGSSTEGSTMTFNVTGVIDPSPADVLAGFTYGFDLGNDGTFDQLGPASQWSLTTADNGTYAVRVRVSDKDGQYTDYLRTVTVTNVAPTAALSDSAAVAGTPTAIGLSGITDPSAADVAAGLRYSFDLDDDGVFEVLDSTTPSASHTFMTAGTHVVQARVRDKDGGATTYQAAVTVSLPPAPTAVFASGGAVDEGSAGSVSFSSATGYGPLSYAYDFDNNGSYDIPGTTAASAVVPASYLSDGPFIRTVRGRVTDAFGQSAEYTAGITVRNVAPTFLIPAAANGSVVLGTGYSLSVAADDPGKDAVRSWTIDWGDHRPASTINAAAGVGRHDYAAAGLYSITVSATDDDGTYSEAHAVLVTADPPTAALQSPGPVAPDVPYRFSVTYADDLGVDTATLGDGDVQITGPAGTAAAHLVSWSAGAAPRSVTAVYEVNSPLGAWAWQDDGAYTVSARDGQVKDLQGLSLPAGSIGTFNVAIAPPSKAPDLVVSFAKPAPSPVSVGGKYAASLKVANHGNVVLTPTTVTTRLYLSKDATLDGGDVLVGYVKQKLALSLNASVAVSIPFSAPKGTAAGTYYLLAVADATGTVPERDERNNVSASKPIKVAKATPAKKLIAASHAASSVGPVFNGGRLIDGHDNVIGAVLAGT